MKLKLAFSTPLTIVVQNALLQSPLAGAWITADCGGIIVKARGDSMAYTLPSGDQVDLQISYVDHAGNPAAVDGQVAWSSSDATIIAVVPNASDSTQCVIQAPNLVGNAQVSASADADLGGGVQTIVTLFDVTVIAGEAVAGTITPVGSPVPIPPA